MEQKEKFRFTKKFFSMVFAVISFILLLIAIASLFRACNAVTTTDQDVTLAVGTNLKDTLEVPIKDEGISIVNEERQGLSARTDEVQEEPQEETPAEPEVIEKIVEKPIEVVREIPGETKVVTQYLPVQVPVEKVVTVQGPKEYITNTEYIEVPGETKTITKEVIPDGLLTKEQADTLVANARDEESKDREKALGQIKDNYEQLLKDKDTQYANYHSDDDYQTVVANYEQEILNHQKDVEDRDATIETLKSKDQTKKVEELTAQLGAALARVTTLEGQVQDYESRVYTVEGENAQYWHDQYGFEKAFHTQYSKELDEANATINSKNTEISKLNTEVSSKDATIDEKDKKIAELESRIEALELMLKPNPDECIKKYGAHDFRDGKCVHCNYECPHNGHIGHDMVDDTCHSDVCRLCGMSIGTVDHTFKATSYGKCVCSDCGFETEHNMRHGECTRCGYECEHLSIHLEDSGENSHYLVCNDCGKSFEERVHEYTDGVCACGYKDPNYNPGPHSHTFSGSGTSRKCSTCGQRAFVEVKDGNNQVVCYAYKSVSGNYNAILTSNPPSNYSQRAFYFDIEHNVFSNSDAQWKWSSKSTSMETFNQVCDWVESNYNVDLTSERARVLSLMVDDLFGKKMNLQIHINTPNDKEFWLYYVEGTKGYAYIIESDSILSLVGPMGIYFEPKQCSYLGCDLLGLGDEKWYPLEEVVRIDGHMVGKDSDNVYEKNQDFDSGNAIPDLDKYSDLISLSCTVLDQVSGSEMFASAATVGETRNCTKTIKVSDMDVKLQFVWKCEPYENRGIWCLKDITLVEVPKNWGSRTSVRAQVDSIDATPYSPVVDAPVYDIEIRKQ